MVETKEMETRRSDAGRIVIGIDPATPHLIGTSVSTVK
jgi:hypothetical protein